MKRTVLTAATFLVAGSAAWAATFSGGGGAGTSVIDANGSGDYTSLAEAAADFTGFAGGATGNWNLLIRSDLQETTTSVFGNNTNGHTVTVRPAAGTSVTVTFNVSERRTGNGGIIWDGNILIGPDKQNASTETSSDPAAVHYMKTDNFVIDGSNTPGGTERNLTLLSPASANTGTLIPRYMIRVVGQCDDTAVRNCTIVSDAVGTGEYMCILYNARLTAESLFFLPQRARVINCGLKANRGNTGRGVYSAIQGSVGVAAGMDAMRGYLVSNCDIEVSHRAVQYGFNAGGEISFNRIKVNQETAGQRPEVIIHTGSNNVTFPWTTDIIGNHVSQVVSLATNGLNYVIGVGAGNATTPAGTYNIVNNMIGGVHGTATITAATSMLGRAIAIENGANPATYNIRHNSISMADIPNYGPNGEDDTNNRLAGLSFFNANNFSGTVNFENNIFNYRQHNASLISNQPTHSIAAATLNFNNNAYFLGAGAKFAELNGTAYATLADWQAAGRDPNSNVVDPLAPPSGGAWVSDTDQHFTADPAAAFDGVAITGITTDIDGDPRPTPPTKGADEFTVTAAVENWMLY